MIRIERSTVSGLVAAGLGTEPLAGAQTLDGVLNVIGRSYGATPLPSAELPAQPGLGSGVVFFFEGPVTIEQLTFTSCFGTEGFVGIAVHGTLTVNGTIAFDESCVGLTTNATSGFGGGGGFGTAGSGSNAGAPSGSWTLIPLRGGHAGAGFNSGSAGPGGPALLLAARDLVSVNNTALIDVSGADAPAGSNGGGGSGGAVLIEAGAIVSGFQPARVDVSGGSGDGTGGLGGRGRVRVLSGDSTDPALCPSLMNRVELHFAATAPPTFSAQAMVVPSVAGVSGCNGGTCFRSDEDQFGALLAVDGAHAFAGSTGLSLLDAAAVPALTAVPGFAAPLGIAASGGAVATAVTDAIAFGDSGGPFGQEALAMAQSVALVSGGSPASPIVGKTILAIGAQQELLEVDSDGVRPVVVAGASAPAARMASYDARVAALAPDGALRLLERNTDGSAALVAGFTLDVDGSEAISTDGSIVAIGQPLDSRCGTGAGVVRLFRLYGSQLVEKFNVGSTDPRAQGGFGRAVSMRGAILAVRSADALEVFRVLDEEVLPLRRWELPADTGAGEVGIDGDHIWFGLPHASEAHGTVIRKPVP